MPLKLCESNHNTPINTQWNDQFHFVGVLVSGGIDTFHMKPDQTFVRKSQLSQEYLVGIEDK